MSWKRVDDGPETVVTSFGYDRERLHGDKAEAFGG
jgi:hypothetical protein